MRHVRPIGRGSGLVAAAALALALVAPVALAVTDAAVSRFLQHSNKFHAQLPQSDVAGLSDTQRRARAVCILSRFEDAYGSDGVQQLMGLMSVLSRGTEFDDPTVVAFNQRFGGAYDRTVRACTRAARSS